MGNKKELEQYDTDVKVPATSKGQIRAAIAAHLAGYPYDVIAEKYGYSNAKTAQTAIENYLGKTYTNSDLASARNRSLSRKERLLQEVWWDATHRYETDSAGNPTTSRNESHFQALDRAIRIAEGIDRLLGLNAPTQVEIYRPGADEFLSTVAELRAEVMKGQPEEADIFDAELVDDEDES